MKKTLKEELQPSIVETYLDDNSLLKVRRTNNNTLEVVIQFIENSYIKEHLLMTMDHNLDQYYEINDDNSAIAIYKERYGDLILRKAYDVKNHELIPEEFIDIFYSQKFNKEISDHLVIGRTSDYYKKYTKEKAIIIASVY